MSDQGEHYHRQHTNRVSSTSDVRMGQRNQMFARSPHPSHSSGLERVEEESSAVVDSSTDHKYRPAYMYSNHHGMEQQNVSHGNMTFKRSTQQGYFRFPITPPYYDNRYSCTNPMCRETQYCYEHQINPYISSSVPMPSSPFMHDCSFPRQVCRKSPLLLNQNAIKSRVEDDVLRPKHEWPIAYRSNHIMPDPPTPTTPAQHLATLFNNKDNTSIPPSTATSLRSSNLEPFMHPSNFPSPRQSARLTRKRAMSTSPALSIDSIDINSLIRTSPDSLIAYINAPRLSSAGSYGHLSASGVSPSPKPPRSSLMRSPMFGCWQTTPTLGLRPMSSQHSDQKDKEPEVKQAIVKEENTCSDKDIKQEKNEKEDNMIVDEKLPSFTSYTETDKRESDAENEENNEGVGGKDKNNNKFLCQWKDCNILFQTQEDLVKHVNTDHIKKEKRDFTCHWIDCQREQKPFKAQYMLVVHMRRHTGEKPNKCSFKGCNKAYSRLENLKTHERSHTGERPYVCEFENCTKAFTNASDRAKHQNRTHSSVKPYICTVEGCTKRYTDPSSLRKHKKTCHPEHFNGAKKPKVDEGKRKQPSEGTKNVAGEIKSSTTNNSSIKRKTQISNHSNRTGDQSSTGSKDPKDSGQGKNMLNLQPAEFSPQSFSGELTSSSSCVDSPHSTHVACEETDENPISPATVGTQNKSNTSSKSPKANELRSVPDRREMPELGLGGGGDVLVENPIVPNRLSLPTINKQNDVGKWVADVTQSMNHVNRYPNELRENYAVDYSSRRSSESGVSSYISSRRSSEMSTVTKQPYTTVPTVVEETVNDIFSPNKHINDAQKQQKFPPINQWNPRHSPAPDALHMEQRRSSSGYGSHHNLAVIRSPVFHKVPMQNSTEPLPNRRMSDSIICEADSSNRYLPIKNNNMGSRRSSEPVSNYYSNGSSDLHSQYYPQIRQNGSSDLHSQYYPQSMQNIQHTLESNYGPHNMINNHRAHSRPQPLDRGQKLTHYPYSIEQRNSPYQPNPPNHNVRCKPPQPNLQQTTNLWQHEHHINQQLLKVRDGESQCSILPGQIYQNDVSGSTMNQQPGVECDRIVNNHGAEGSYESMLNGINNLNTNDMAHDPGLQNIPSNMVINDMNTLLNSLIEEERYLDKNQAQSNMTSMLSHIF